MHFVIAGVVLGIAVPIALTAAYVFVDPRIRFTGGLEQEFGLPLLGVVPHMVSSPAQRMRQADFKFFALLLIAAALAYVAVVTSVVVWG